MGSLYHDRVRSIGRSISARNSPLLHNPPETGSQVADGTFGHRDRAATFCLNIPDDHNRDRRVFIGQNQDKRFQIGNDCDRQDTNRPIGRCSSSEVLNQQPGRFLSSNSPARTSA